MDGKGRENKPRQRLKGLFSKEKKVTSTEEVNEFLYGTTDKLEFADAAFAPPRPLSNNNPFISTLPRTTMADARKSECRDARGRSASPRRSGRDWFVQSQNEQPVIIGTVEDFAESPITLRNRAYTHQTRDQFERDWYAWGMAGRNEIDAFQAGPIRRTQTGHTSIPEIMEAVELDSTTLGNQHEEPHATTASPRECRERCELMKVEPVGGYLKISSR